MIKYLLNIQFIEHYETTEGNSYGFVWDLGKDYLLPVFLAFLAGGVAYLIFIRETKRDKAKEEAKLKQERTDKLFYLSFLMENIVLNTTEQKNNLKKHITAIETDDVEFHLLEWVPLNDIKRVAEEMKLEEYLLAYVDYYNTNRKDSVLEFKKTIASVDFLFEIFKQLPKQIEKAQAFDLERKMQIQKLYAEAHNRLASLSIVLQRHYPEEFEKLTPIMKRFHENFRDSSDIQFYNDFFFVPINDFCVERIKPRERIIDHMPELAILTRDCKQLFQLIKSENRRLQTDMLRDARFISKTIAELKRYSLKLRNLTYS